MTVFTGGKDKKKKKKGKGKASDKTPPRDHLKDPLTKPEGPKLGMDTQTKVDGLGGTASLKQVDTQVDGSSQSVALSRSPRALALSRSNENGWGEGSSQSVKLDGKKKAIGLSQTQSFVDGSASQSLSVSKGGLNWVTSAVDANKNSSARAWGAGPNGVSFADTQRDARGITQHQNALSLGPGQASASMVRNGRGGGFRTGPDGTFVQAQKGPFGVELGVTPEMYVAGASARVGKNSASLRVGAGEKGWTFDAGISLANRGVSVGRSDIDGEQSERQGVSLGFLALGEQHSILDREQEGYQDQGLLGPGYSSSHVTGHSDGGNGAFFLSLGGGSGQKQGYSVDSKAGRDGRISLQQGMRHGAVQKALESGLPVDPQTLAMNQGYSRSQEEDQNWRVGADVLLADGSLSGSSREGSVQSVSRLEDGIHLRDTYSEQQGSGSSWGLGLGILHNSEANETSQAVQVLEYLVDPEDPQGMSYALDYAHAGLLPEWDCWAEQEDVDALRRALRVARINRENPKIWQEFRSEQAGRIAKVNAAIRERHASGSVGDPSLGVRLLHATGSEKTDEDHNATTLLFFGSSSSEMASEGIHHGVDADGSAYTERSFSRGASQDGEDQGSREVTVSGDLNAPNGLTIQNHKMKRYRDHKMDLSPAVLQALGEELNASKKAAAIWSSMTRRATQYWQIQSHEPTGDGWRHRYATMFEDVDGPEAFLEFSAQHQLAYIKGACTQPETGYRGRGDTPALDKSGTRRGFDVLAALSSLEEGRAREEGMMVLAEAVTAPGREPFDELRATGRLVPGGGEYLAAQAGQGRRLDANMVVTPQDGKVWAKELLVTLQASSSWPAFKLLEAVHTVGGAELLEATIREASLSAYTVALKLASDSQDNPRVFMGWMGDRGGDRLQRWWSVTRDNLGQQAIARAAKIDAAKPENQPKLDGGRGLGDAGMDMEQVRIQMEIWEAKQNAPLGGEVPVMRAAGSSSAAPSAFPGLRAPAIPVWEGMRLAAQLDGALKAKDYAGVIETLTSVRGQYGADGVEQVVLGRAGMSAPWPGQDTPEGRSIRALLKGTLCAP